MNNDYGNYFKNAYCVDNIKIVDNGGSGGTGKVVITKPTDPPVQKASGLPLGIIIGAAVGGICILAIAIYSIVYCCNRGKSE